MIFVQKNSHNQNVSIVQTHIKIGIRNFLNLMEDNHSGKRSASALASTKTKKKKCKPTGIRAFFSPLAAATTDGAGNNTKSCSSVEMNAELKHDDDEPHTMEYDASATPDSNFAEARIVSSDSEYEGVDKDDVSADEEEHDNYGDVGGVKDAQKDSGDADDKEDCTDDEIPSSVNAIKDTPYNKAIRRRLVDHAPPCKKCGRHSIISDIERQQFYAPRLTAAIGKQKDYAWVTNWQRNHPTKETALVRLKQFPFLRYCNDCRQLYCLPC